MAENRPPSNGARQVLEAMKGLEPQTAEQLAARLNVSSVAMRLRLNELERKKLIRFAERTGRIGRPLRVWSLADAADVLFPDAHAALAVDLLASFKAIYGKKALRTLVVRREKEMLTRYRTALASVKGTTKKVAKLATLRTQEGYMAESRKTQRGVLLVENHCPICAAAKECQQFCRSELRVFQEALGDGVKIERIDHILAGARRCAYLVTECKDSAEPTSQP